MFQRSKIGSGVLLALGTLLAATAHAQDGDVQRVEVTGSAIKRINIEGALPVQTLTSEDFKRAGQQTLTDVLQSLPAMQQFETSSQSINGGGGGITTANIHGIGSGYTLVLLNGHRFASYGTGSTVNLNQIPLGVVDHIDVLTDGASAVYGADAIAGVVNIVTKRDSTDGSVDVSADVPFKKGGRSAAASISKGFGDLDKDRFNVFVGATFEHQQALEASARSFSKSGVLNFNDAYGNETVYLTSTSTPAANVKYKSSVNGTTYVSPSLANGGSCTGSNTVYVAADALCEYDYAATVQDIPASRSSSFLTTARFKLNDKVQLWAEAVLGSSRTDARFAAPAQAFSLSDSQVASYVTPQLASGETATGDTGYVRLIGTGGRKDGYQYNTQHFVAGADVTTGDWDSTFSFTHSQNHFYDIAEGGYASANAIAALMDSGAYDPFSGAAQSDVLASAVLHQTLDQSRSTLDIAHAQTSGPIWHLPAGDVQLATGMDIQRQKYTDRPSAILQGANALQPDYTDTLFGGSSGTLPFDSSRNSWGVFAELQAPVTKKLNVGASARFDSYGAIHNKEGFDASGNPIGSETQGKKNSATTFKLDSDYRPFKELLLRASLGTGFRVPTIADISSPLQFYGVTGKETCSSNAPSDLAEYCSNQAAEYNEQSGGNPASGAGALKPERSTQWTLGFRFEPSPAFSLGMDLWTVRIRDQISTVSEQTAFGNMATYASLFSIVNDPATGDPTLTFLSQPINTGNAFYQGIDLDAESHISTPIGKLTTHGHVTYNLRADYQEPGQDGYLNDLSKVGTDGAVTFRYQIDASTSLEHGAFTSTVGFHFKPGYKDDYSDYCYGSDYEAGTCNADSPNRRVSSYATFDFQERYQVTKAFTVTAGIKNVFDRNPPFSLIDQSGTGNARGYDGRYTSSLGRTFAASASYKF